MRASLFLALSLLAFAPAPQAHAQAQQDFVLANRTGYQIDEVYVSAARVNNWEEDVLGDRTLPNGGDLRITFPRRTQDCIFDIKVVYSDEEEAEFRGLDLCRVSKVTIFYNRSAGTTRYTVE